ncbi:MAG: hypothetical protein KDA49_13590 [Rhodospirillaceae bacterium]|nr:hypothetical protein [Rhodospirillaceae bacterium]
MYVSPTLYRDWSCEELREEQHRIGSHAAQVADLQDDAAGADVALTAIGIVVFWPALFALAATDDHEHELARLRGEYEAIGTAMTSGHCHATETAADTPRPAIASDDEPAVGGAEAGPQEAISPPQTRDGRLQDIDRRIEAITNNCGNPERCDDAIAQLTLERDRLANARD